VTRTLLGCVLLAGLVATSSLAAEKTTPPLICALVGDELRIRIAKPHGRELAVLAPNGILYLLAFEPRPDAPDEPRSPFERFATAQQLSVDVRTLEGWRTQVGQQRWEKVFTRPGIYEVRSAEDLSAAYDAPSEFGLSSCHVTRK
jgi:hypothetical protein